MWYFVCFSTSLSLNVNYVLYTTNTCHSNKSGPLQNHKTFISKRYEFKTIAYDTYNDSTCTAQTCPVDGTETCPVDGTGGDSEVRTVSPTKKTALIAARPVDRTGVQHTSLLKTLSGAFGHLNCIYLCFEKR